MGLRAPFYAPEELCLRAPQVTGCGDGVTCHVRTFLHGGCRITMSIATLPSHDALPGEERGQVWTWLRPKGASEDINRAVRRCGCTRGLAYTTFHMCACHQEG